MNEMSSSPEKPDVNDSFSRDERNINSSPIWSSRYSENILSTDSEDDSDEGDIVDKLERSRKNKSEALYKPMSSPIRGQQRSGKGGFKSKSLRSKYTLRTRQYVPFKQKQLDYRDQQRNERQLAQRGGMEGMERFIQAQGTKEDLNNLNAEAAHHMFDIEEIDEGINKGGNIASAYEQELEDMLRREEEELEQLTSNMTLESS